MTSNLWKIVMHIPQLDTFLQATAIALSVVLNHFVRLAKELKQQPAEAETRSTVPRSDLPISDLINEDP